jgi:hypothetical protein
VGDTTDCDIRVKKNDFSAESGVAWGAKQIGLIIGRTERQAHHLLTTGQIASAQKKGGRWMAGKAALVCEFGLS